MRLGERIQSLRKNKGYSQQEFADILGIGRSTLANYEQCKREPDYETLELIAKELSVNPAYLLGWIDEHNKSKVSKKSYNEELDYDPYFMKADRYFYTISGIYNLYINHKSKIDKWFWQQEVEISKCISSLSENFSSMESFYVPFYNFDISYDKQSQEILIEDLTLLRDKLNDSHLVLYSMVQDNQLIPSIGDVESNDIVSYFMNQNIIEDNTLDSADILKISEKLLDKCKKELKLFKKMTGIKDDEQVYL